MSELADKPALIPLSETSTYSIARTYALLFVVFERYMGLTRARWQMLTALSRCDWISQSQLTQVLEIDGAAITRQIKQLEEEGIVERKIDPQDNRFMLVSLTEQGRHLYEGLRERRNQFEQRITEGLGDEEISQLKQILSHLQSNLREWVKELE